MKMQKPASPRQYFQRGRIFCLKGRLIAIKQQVKNIDTSLGEFLLPSEKLFLKRIISNLQTLTAEYDDNTDIMWALHRRQSSQQEIKTRMQMDMISSTK